MENELLDLIIRNETLQEFTDAAGRLIGLPFWIMDESFRILSLTHSPSAQEYENRLLNRRRYYEYAQAWIDAGINKQLGRQKILHRIDPVLETEVILTDIRKEGRVIGRMTVFADREHDCTDEMIMKLAEICVIYLRNDFASENAGLKEQMLISLLDHTILPEECTNASAFAGVSPKGPYRLAVMKSDLDASGNAFFLQSLIRILRSASADAVIILRDHQCIALESGTSLVPYLDYHSLKAGYSLEFSHLSGIDNALLQAEYALEKSTGRITYFSDVYREYFTDFLSVHLDAEAFLYPKVRQIIAYDDMYHTEYCRTLKAYYEQGCSKERTARALDVHLNTVKYRISQIEKLFAVDMKADREAIEISFLLLAGNQGKNVQKN